MLDIYRISAFQDNYIWVISQDNQAVIVDPGEGQAVLNWLEKNQHTPIAIFITHHHSDHCGGISTLLNHYPNLKVFGPAKESIIGVNIPLEQGDQFEIFDEHFQVLEVPGHTLGHIAYVGDEKLFCGDVLFSAGCGRIFEGTTEQMYHSLQILKTLPDETQVYCAHEYTAANVAFACSVEPNNKALLQYREKVNRLIAHDQATLPTSIGLEKQINPFLRCDKKILVQSISPKLPVTNEEQVFATLRKWKDTF